MQRVSVLIFSVLVSIFSIAQVEDPVIMKIGERTVLRSEFEYHYNKNNSEDVLDKMTPLEYAQLHAAYRLKVMAAEDAKLDTMKSYQAEFRKYRDQQIRPLLVDEKDIENECQQYYNNMLSSLQGKNLLLVAHIFQLLPQRADANLQAEKKTRIDSIYAALQGGADFATLARLHSDDKGSAENGGELPWIGPGQTLQEFEDVAYSLKKGETSQPFLSTVGYHIVKLIDERPLEPYDTLHNKIKEFLESRGVRQHLANQVIDSIGKTTGKGLTVEEILDKETERLCSEDFNLRMLIDEYHDGLLLYEICNRNIWEPAKKDTVALTSFFKQNKKNYAWSVPHYRGMAYYCKDASLVKQVQKVLKKVPEDKWIKTIRESFNKDSIQVKMERRMFIKGENGTIDAIAFKDKSAKVKVYDGYPYAGVIGTALKKGPEKWTDVANAVIDDYQQKCMDTFVEELKKKYQVTIFEDVVNTVNQH